MVESVRELTDHKGVWQDTDRLVGDLNRRLVGWANYFSIGTTSAAYRIMESYTTSRLRRWLLREHKLRRSGNLMYSYEYLFQTLGLVQLTSRRSNLPWAYT